MSVQQQTIRRVVWTGAIAAVTAVGAWYGAGLKTTQEIQQETTRRREATTEEKLALLQEARSVLVGKRLGIERKMQELEARRNGATRAESKVGQERRRD